MVLASSFMLKDIGADKVWGMNMSCAGSFMAPLIDGIMMEAEMLCILPINGASNSRENRGCGLRHNRMEGVSDLSGEG